MPNHFEFVVENQNASDFVIQDLGQTIAASAELDLALYHTIAELRCSTDLDAAFTSVDLVRLDGLGGSPVPAGFEFSEILDEKMDPDENDYLFMEDSINGHILRIVTIGRVLSTGVSEYDNGSQAGPNWTLDWTNGVFQTVTLAGDITNLTITPPSGSCNLALIVKQDATGSRQITWPSSVLWPGGTAPTLSGADATDVIRMHYNGTSYYSEGLINFA
jgi:hypothetical protein